MRITTPTAILTTSACVLMLAGCGSPTSSSGVSAEDSPLAQYLAAAWGGDLSPEEQQRQQEKRQAAVEERVAECMTAEGFEYTPNTDSSDVVTGDEWQPDDRKWVEQYGYGFVTNPFSEQMEDHPEEGSDPNAAYIETLSESEKTAFYETLYGATPSDDELSEDGSFEYRWEDAGCQGAAQHEVEGDDPTQLEEFSALQTKLEELTTKSQESPELADLNAEWAACMADKGEPGFSRQTDAADSISDEQSKLYDAAYGDGTDTEELPEVTEPSDSPEMKALGEREIELALIDLECREKTSYTRKSLEIQFALEEQFIAENKAELDAFKAAAEQSKR